MGWQVGPRFGWVQRRLWKHTIFRVSRGIRTAEGSRGVAANGLGGVPPGGVNDDGTRNEDGPVTWEAPNLHVSIRCDGEPVTHLQRARR